MFSNQYSCIKKDSNGKIEKSGPYFLQLIQQEKSHVNKIKKDESLVITENPRIKLRKEETDICKELRECKLHDFLELKRRQQLRANNHELLKLQTQLQSALVFKELQEQRNYMAHKKAEELRKKREENVKFLEECELSKQLTLKHGEEEKRKKEAFRAILNDQINDRNQRRHLEFEEVIKDREQMEKLLNRMKAEDMQERKRAKLLREKYRKEMEDSYRNRELQWQLEKEKNVDDNERYLAYQKECDDLKAKIAMEKKLHQIEKEALSERIGQQLAELNNEKQKRESLLLSLLVEERKAKEDQYYRKNLEKQIKQREQLRTELDIYRNEIRIEKEKKLKEEEEQLCKEQMLYLAERDKLDQLSDEKRRRKKIEHNKALRDMIEMRRIERAKGIADSITDFVNLLKDEKEREKQIEDERRRILSTAPKELLMYLPPGVIKSSDREFLTHPN